MGKYFTQEPVYTECGNQEGTEYNCCNCEFSTENFSEIQEHIMEHTEWVTKSNIR